MATQTMKRKGKPNDAAKPAKKARPSLPKYHETPSKSDKDGQIIWPAPRDQIENARRIIRECAASKAPTVICPDKDADGLSSGLILSRTLQFLGLPAENIGVHLLAKNTTVHDDATREAFSDLLPSDAVHPYVFILDHGSRPAPPVLPESARKSGSYTALVIDHHAVTDSPESFPQHANYVSAANSPPVATSSLLTYLLCADLHESVSEPATAWLAALGTFGDLGNTLEWSLPLPDMSHVFSAYSKKTITDAVPLVNAPRRTADYNVKNAWNALEAAKDPKDILKSSILSDAREQVSAETERCSHSPPKFSEDGCVAVLRINSKAQVHPVVATRWAGFLKSNKLKWVMVANEGYVDGLVNFSGRVARSAKSREGYEDGTTVDIQDDLKKYARLHDSGTLLERLGPSFARGHVQASGGIVGKEEFEELMSAMKIGEGKRSTQKTSPKKANEQSNTLKNYFGAST
ncbi:MAG: hypothetical protein M1828_007148 [Chrysothrix sp. TS-e1954]|nr:MAG: hypothetical protein M1828_007148 [Chrysothrix sp. TS-e1954]